MILNGHSYYSLRYGTLSIKELIDIAKANQYNSIALTDINNTSGVLHFVKACELNRENMTKVPNLRSNAYLVPYLRYSQKKTTQ